MDALITISEYGVLPVLGLKNPNTAVQTADALRKGGLPLLEITMRAPQAMDCLKTIKMNRPDMLVGAGTILSPSQADEAINAGADFIVAPGLNRKVVEYCLERGVPVVPGCATASEIEAGMEFGLDTFKFFPAEALGGIENIRQLSGPYNGIRFIPTSGISFDNMEKYLCCSKVAAVGGSFVAPAEMVAACRWEEIAALCRKAVDQSLGFSLAHIGINGNCAEEGLAIAQWFAERFGFPVYEGKKSNFVGKIVEACNQKFPGSYGHIAIGTWSPMRAEAYLKRKGVALREEFKATAPDGELKSVYLQDEVGGFAVHVVKR